MIQWTHNVVNNDDRYRDFAHAIGYALLNASQLELFTFSFIALFENTHVFDTGRGNISFADRRKKVVNLLDTANLHVDLHRKAIALWDDAVEIMQWRNILAHNPISILSITDEHGCSQEHVSIINMKTTSTEKVDNLDISQVTRIVNEAERVVRGLASCLDEIRASLAD